MKLNVVFVVITLLIIIFCSAVLKPKPEGFQLLNPASFPCSTEKPNLYGDYPVKKKPHVTELEYADIWTEYPTTQVGSYDQVTNNKKYWKNPNNGTCIRADMCNGIYNDKTLDIPPQPPMLKFGEGIRVNYYDSHVAPDQEDQ